MPVTTLSTQLNNLLQTRLIDENGHVTWPLRTFLLGLAGPTTAIIPLAKITGGGANGYLGFNDFGLLTEYQEPT
jgi:hypothetical protein